jgi:transposase
MSRRPVRLAHSQQEGQAGLGGQQHPGPVRSGDAGGHHRRRGRPDGAGAARPAAVAGQDPGPGAGADREARAHQRFLLAEQLARVDFLDAAIERLGAEIAARLQPAEEVVARLQAIPGIGRRTAELLIAEIGVDVERFPSAAHLAS